MSDEAKNNDDTEEIHEKSIGFLHDSSNDKSSKRLQSFIGLISAIAMPFVAGFIKKQFGVDIPTTEITLTFLLYSAAMQGVVLLSEKIFGK